MKRIVLDTNIIVSAAISPEGNASRILRWIKDNLDVCFFYNPAILAEYANVLSRVKLKISKQKNKKLFLHRPEKKMFTNTNSLIIFLTYYYLHAILQYLLKIYMKPLILLGLTDWLQLSELLIYSIIKIFWLSMQGHVSLMILLMPKKIIVEEASCRDWK